MRPFPAHWWVVGGWALDGFLGRVTREHSDLEIGVLRRDQHLIRGLLPASSRHKLVPQPQGRLAWSHG